MMTTQKELIATIATQAAVSKEVATRVITALSAHVIDAMHQGAEVSLPQIGKLSVVKREARKGRNPQTGEEIEIPEKYVPHFSPAKPLKDAAAL